jgi:7,8-dihydropterin-6-yl-methyl-4-(beta-D-ribofuranosyl)aminobenzene 5'-phosphate synthase
MIQPIQIKGIVLIDNNPNPLLNLHSEHGLSIYFEADGFKWLMDVGASNKFYENAIDLGIAIEDVDFLIISHGHCDHTGGLEKFLKVNKKAKIYISKHIIGKQFFSYRTDIKQNITINHSVVEQNIARFTFVDSNLQISKNVNLICQFSNLFPTPKGNNKLYIVDEQGERNDDFKHEISVTVNTTKGIVVFSGCSHNGVLNILETCTKHYKHTTIAACIGGTHLLDSGASSNHETEVEILEIGKSITKQYPLIRLITGHCTGILAQKNFTNIFKENLSLFYSGYSIEL